MIEIPLAHHVPKMRWRMPAGLSVRLDPLRRRSLAAYERERNLLIVAEPGWGKTALTIDATISDIQVSA